MPDLLAARVEEVRRLKQEINNLKQLVENMREANHQLCENESKLKDEVLNLVAALQGDEGLELPDGTIYNVAVLIGALEDIMDADQTSTVEGAVAIAKHALETWKSV